MRLKKNAPTTSAATGAGSGAQSQQTNNDLNGSTSSNSSVSNNNGIDDLDMDSGDDEIDVGTHADSFGFGSKSSGSNGGGSNASTLSNNANGENNMGASGSGGGGSNHHHQGNGMSEADRKRAHHNALERKRRDHIKDSFHTLRDAIPNIKGEKVSVSTSRAQILKAATDYIKIMRTRNVDYQQDIDSLKRQNNEIENQIRQLEKAKQAISQNPATKLNLPRTEFLLKSEPLVKNEPNLQSNEFDDNGNANLIGATSSSTHLTDLQNDSHTTSSNFNQTSNFTFIAKPITTTLINTSTNPKKFKTIINPKSSLNIINISNSNTNSGTTVITTKAPTTIQLNANNNSNVNSNENDYF